MLDTGSAVPVVPKTATNARGNRLPTTTTDLLLKLRRVLDRSRLPPNPPARLVPRAAIGEGHLTDQCLELGCSRSARLGSVRRFVAALVRRSRTPWVRVSRLTSRTVH